MSLETAFYWVIIVVSVAAILLFVPLWIHDARKWRDTSGSDWATFHGYECTCSAWFGRHATTCPHHPSFRRDKTSE